MLLWRRVRIAWRRAVLVLVFVIIAVLLAHEVFRAFVFVRAAILRYLSARDSIRCCSI
jgi:hypothetical protein